MEYSEIGKIFLVAAPSGAGKTTVVNRMLDILGGSVDISRVVTYTTRKPRPGEIDGRDYFFVSKEEFKELEREGFFAETNEYDGEFYGTPIATLEETLLGGSVVAIVDINGVEAIRAKFENVVSIWIRPPTVKDLELRLRSRGTESEKKIKERLKIAEEEMKRAAKSGMFDYVVVNADVEESARELAEVVNEELAAIGHGVNEELGEGYEEGYGEYDEDYD